MTALAEAPTQVRGGARSSGVTCVTAGLCAVRNIDLHSRMQSRKARESFQQFLSLVSLLEGNECEHTDALAFGGESDEDSLRGADFARGPVRQVRTGPSGCRTSVVPVVSMTVKAGGQAGSGVRKAAGRE